MSPGGTEGRVQARTSSAPAACFSVEIRLGHMESRDTPRGDLTTVDDKSVSRDIAGFVACEVDNRPSDVTRLSGNP